MTGVLSLIVGVSMMTSSVFANPVNRAAPAMPGQARPAMQPIEAAATASDSVQFKIRVKESRRYGSFMDIAFQLVIEGLPRNKEYHFLLQDMGMARAGLPPAQIPSQQPNQRWHPNDAGSITFDFAVDHFVKGEWVQYTIRSTDGKVDKTVRFVPFK